MIPAWLTNRAGLLASVRLPRVAIVAKPPILSNLFSFRKSAIALTTALALILVAPSSAASLRWGPSGSGGSGTWDANETVQWFNGVNSVKWPAAGGVDDDAVFAGSPGTISIANGGITANDIAFNTTGYSIQGQTITLNGSSPSITTAGGVISEISSMIAGSAGLAKAGTGTLILRGNNSFSGNVVLGDTSGGIASGTLRITHGGALGTGSKNVFIRNGSSFLELDGSAGNLSIPGNINYITSGTPIRNLAGDNIIHGNIQMNTGAGDTTILCNSGSLALHGAINAGSLSRTLVLSGNSNATNIVGGVIANGGQANKVRKSGTGTWCLSASNTYTGTTTINSGKLIGITGGSCAHSAVTLAATTGDTALLGVSITDKTKRWSCASLTINNGGTASDLKFDFGTITPSTTLAPLNIVGTLDFTTTPHLHIFADSNLGPIGTKFPLISWGSITGTAPTTFTLTTSNPTTARLEVTGNTLYLVIDDYTPTLSDTQLFSAIHLDYPGLEAVKLHVQAGDFPAAKGALATYLRTRTNINWFYDWKNPTPNVSFNKSSADSQIAGTFSFGGYTNSFPNGEIDWLYTPNPSSQWVSLMNRMNFWPNFGATYWGTGDENYVTAWTRQLRSWITQCPAPSNSQSILSSWATIQAAERMRTWPDTFLRFVLSPSLADEDVILYLKSTIENTRYLRQYSIGAAMNFNIDAWELNGIYTTATVFPELKEASEWRAYAVQQMAVQKSLQFYPDGVHIELSPRYHIGTLGFIAGIHQLAGLNNRLTDLPPGYIESTEKAFEFLLYHSAPSRLMPPFNDCGAANEDSRTYLQQGYSLFPHRSDFLWTSGGGTKPAKTSWNFPYAGYAAMRSGWENNAHFLCFDAGPLGSSGHRHEDKLNIVIWAHGRELLFDSGGGSYESSIWRTWGTSSYSHNCITVDGMAQKGGDGSYQATDADYQSQGPVNMRWESGYSHDFAAGIYDRGYGSSYSNRPATQTRRVLFVKPDLYLVADTMVPNSTTTSHSYQARWHLLSPNTSFDPVTKTVVTNDPGQANLAIVPCLGTGLSVENISARLSNSGSTTPVLSEMLGWDQPNLSAGTQTPATTVTQTRTGTGPQHFLTLFLPLKAGQTNPVTAITNPTATSAEINLSDGRRLLVEADPDPTRGLKLTEIMPDNQTGRYVGAGFNPPAIAGLSDQQAAPSAVISQLLIITDDSPVADITLSAHSLNQALLPDANLTFTGSGNHRTLTARLEPNRIGSATVIVTVLDPDGSTTRESFEIEANYPPDSPPTANPGNTTTLPGTAIDIDLGTLASDAETPTSHLLFKVSSPANGNVILLADGRTARFTPNSGFRGSASFQYSSTDLGNDPRIHAYYAMESPDDVSAGIIQDASLNQRPATLSIIGTGSAQLTFDAPSALAAFSTQSVLLTERGDTHAARLSRILDPADLNLNDQNWTFACWFKRANSNNEDFILHLGTGNGFGSEEELQLYGQAGSSRVGLAHWNGSAADMNLLSGQIAPAGQWHHVAVTYTRISAKRGNLAYYINGSLAGSANNIPFNFNPSHALNIGGHAQSAASSRWFHGHLDEAVIVEAALTSQEISLLASQPVSRLGGLTATNTVTVQVGASLTEIEKWRQLHFGSTGNTGHAADSFDANNDGENNLLEFATGQSPHTATRALTNLSNTAAGLKFTYQRSKSAFDSGYQFNIQHNNNLEGLSWNSIGPGTVGETNGDLQTVTSTIPATDPLFVRLRIDSP
jgi:autotransporter-associated beta strand protein